MSVRAVLIGLGMAIAAAATAQKGVRYFPVGEHRMIVLVGVNTPIELVNSGVTWKAAPEREVLFEAWRKKLPGAPQTSDLVLGLKNKGNLLPTLAKGSASIEGDRIIFTFTAPPNTKNVVLQHMGTAWNEPPDAVGGLAALSDGLGIPKGDTSALSHALGGPSYDRLTSSVQAGEPYAGFVKGRLGVVSIESKAKVGAVPTPPQKDPTPKDPVPSGKPTVKKAVVPPDDKSTSGAMGSVLLGALGGGILVAAGFLFAPRLRGRVPHAKIGAKEESKAEMLTSVTPVEKSLVLWFRQIYRAPNEESRGDRQEQYRLDILKQLNVLNAELTTAAEVAKTQAERLKGAEKFGKDYDSFVTREAGLKAKFDDEVAKNAAGAKRVKELSTQIATLTKEKGDTDKLIGQLTLERDRLKAGLEGWEAFAATLNTRLAQVAENLDGDQPKA